ASPLRPIGSGLRVGFALVASLTLAAVVYALAGGRLTPLFTLIVLQGILQFQARHRIEAAIHNLGANGEGLTIFAAVLACIPNPPAFLQPGPTALRRLAHLADWIDACDTLLGRVLDFTVLYSLQLAAAAEAWRQRHAAAMSSWLAAVGEFEALASIATYSFEHPGDPFPELVESTTPLYAADELTHPLLPEAVAVRNSLCLNAETGLLIVSGSNMAGKSTLLRAVGCNAVLALMGAPVRAHGLRLTPLQLGTRLRTSDSLQQGRSGFYAEILRLRQVYELCQGQLPVLYLFDELLEGTNSHDRVRGAQGLLQALLRHPTLGMVTTHDLALATMAADLGSRVRNVHLEDQIEGNDVRFDHKLRDGQVTKSNALALMRIVGLEI
ncbi:MAG: MutS-related protein, partial [Terriglobales bacterium]